MEGRILIISMEILVALVATITYSKYRHNNLRYFLWYVWGVVLIELLGTGWSSYVQTSNLWIYNSLVILQFPLLVLWYRKFLTSPRTRRALIWLIATFLIFAIINSWGFQTFWEEFQSFNFILGAICLIISIFLYFNEVLHTEKILIIQRGLLFWVSVGFLFFYASAIPIMIMGNFLHHNGWVYNVFLLILNIILHICFLIGLLWGKKKYN